MSVPFFYTADEPIAQANQINLDEDTSKHIVQSLRMQNGEKINLCNGKGIIATAFIADNHRKKCRVEVIDVQIQKPPLYKTVIAISPLKNTSRFEWFAEKAAETGVSEIIPLICQRTERQLGKPERIKNILVSAMLQSRQSWLTVLHEPVKFEHFIARLKNENQTQKFIAHCEETDQKPLLSALNRTASSLILIGPEGDFTLQEIQLATQKNFTAVSLGENRLRTETAALVASILLTLK